MLSLASRSCRGINRVVTGFTKEAKSMTRPMEPSSQKKGPPGSVPTTVKKKHTASQVHFSKKKANVMASTMKGRYVQKLPIYIKLKHSNFLVSTFFFFIGSHLHIYVSIHLKSFYFLFEGNYLMKVVVRPNLRRYFIFYCV